MDGIQLEKLYVAIEAQTEQFTAQMAGVNSRIDNMSSTVNKATKKASGAFGNVGKAVLAAFSIRAVVGFFNKFLEITKQTEVFKKTLAASLTPLIETLKPVLDTIIIKIAQMAATLAGFIQGFFGLTVKGSNDSTKEIIANNNKIKRSYAGFDELNTITETSGASATTTTPEIKPLISQEEIDKFVALGKELANIAKWFLIIVGIAVGLYIFKTITGMIDDLVFAGKGLGFIGTTFNKAYESAYLASTKGGEAVGLFAKAISAFGLTATQSVWLIIGAFAALVAVVAIIGYSLYKLWNDQGSAGIAFRKLISDLVEALKGTFQSFVDLIMALWKIIEPLFAPNGIITTVVNVLASTIIFALTWVLKAFQFIIDFLVLVFTTDWVAVWEGTVILFEQYFSKPITDFLAFIANNFSNFIDFVVAAFMRWVDAIGDQVDNIKKVFNGIINFVTGVFTGDWKKAINGLKDVFNGVASFIISPFKTAFNWVVDLWNNTIGKLSWTIPDWVPVIGGNKISAPKLTKWSGDIPQLANGGMVDAGSLFVAGESGAELIGSHQGRTTVMPLENTNFVGAMKQAMIEGLTEAMGSAGNGNIVLQVGEIELGRAAVKGMNKVSMVDGTLGLNY